MSISGSRHLWRGEDIPATGENPRHCEPVAYSLRLTIGHGSVVAPMDPTMVCGYGATSFERLMAVKPVPTCNASSLQAAFKRYGPYGALLNYALILTNTTGLACYTDSFVGGAGGVSPRRTSRPAGGSSARRTRRSSGKVARQSSHPATATAK